MQEAGAGSGTGIAEAATKAGMETAEEMGMQAGVGTERGIAGGRRDEKRQKAAAESVGTNGQAHQECVLMPVWQHVQTCKTDAGHSTCRA